MIIKENDDDKDKFDWNEISSFSLPIIKNTIENVNRYIDLIQTDFKQCAG